MRYTAILLLSLLAGSELFAGGWTQPKGDGYFALSFQSTRARQFFANDGNTIDINGAGTMLGNYIGGFYGEYGIHDRFTAVTYFPFFVRNTVNEGVGEITGQVLQPGLERNGIGDLTLGFRYRLLQKNRWVVSTTFLAGLPTGISDDPQLLNTGDGEFNQNIQVDVGYGGDKWYATGYLGFNNRTQGFSEEIRFEAEVGFQPGIKGLILGMKFTGVESLDNGDPSDRGNGLFANNVEYLSPQITAAWQADNGLGVSARVGGAFYARNALAAPGMELGVFYKLSKDRS